jgi:S1-C subfamily serine protease
MIFSERHRYTAVLAVIAVVVLILGYRLRPLPKLQNQHADNLNVSRAELENLQQLVRRNSLKSLASSFTNVANDTINHAVLVQPWSVNGVMLPDLGLVIAKRLDAAPRQLTVQSPVAMQSVIPGFWVPGLPFLTGRISGATTILPARVSDSTPALGAWVMVVANGIFGQTLLSPGIYDGIAQEYCGPYIHYRLLTTVPLNQSHLGGGLFDLAGELQGFVLPCEDGPAVIPTSEVKRAIAAVNSDIGNLLAIYGFRLGSEADSSAMVTETWDGWSADLSGIQAGDQLVSVDARPVTTAHEAMTSLLRKDPNTHEIQLRRGKRTVKLQLPPTSAGEAENRPALITDDAQGILVSHISPGTSAETAGIKKGDRILAINGHAATKDIVAKTFESRFVHDPVQVVVRRTSRSVLLVVQP